MKIANDKADAIDLIRRLHREMKAVQNTLAELEYLVYEADERCKIDMFKDRNGKTL